MQRVIVAVAIADREAGTTAESIQPLVVGVELRKDYDQDLHHSQRSMSRARSDHDAHARMNRYTLVIQLHFGVRTTLEKEIRFGQAFVVVQFGICRDLRNVNRCWKIFFICPCAAGSTARTCDRGQLLEIDNFVPRFASGLSHSGNLYGGR